MSLEEIRWGRKTFRIGTRVTWGDKISGESCEGVVVELADESHVFIEEYRDGKPMPDTPHWRRHVEALKPEEASHE